MGGKCHELGKLTFISTFQGNLNLPRLEDLFELLTNLNRPFAIFMIRKPVNLCSLYVVFLEGHIIKQGAVLD